MNLSVSAPRQKQKTQLTPRFPGDWFSTFFTLLGHRGVRESMSFSLRPAVFLQVSSHRSHHPGRVGGMDLFPWGSHPRPPTPDNTRATEPPSRGPEHDSPTQGRPVHGPIPQPSIGLGGVGSGSPPIGLQVGEGDVFVVVTASSRSRPGPSSTGRSRPDHRGATVVSVTEETGRRSDRILTQGRTSVVPTTWRS